MRRRDRAPRASSPAGAASPAAVEGKPRGDVQEPIAQALGLAACELTREQQGLGPGDQIVAMSTSSSQTAFISKSRNGEVPEAGVLVTSDLVLDHCPLAVTALEHRDVGALLGRSRRPRSRWPSWSVNVSCAPGWGRSRRTIQREPSGHSPRSMRWVISATSATVARAAGHRSCWQARGHHAVRAGSWRAQPPECRAAGGRGGGPGTDRAIALRRRLPSPLSREARVSVAGPGTTGLHR